MSSPKMSPEVARDRQEPAGLVSPVVGQVTPLTPEQQKAMATRRKFLQLTVGGSLAVIGVAFAFPVLALKALNVYSDRVADGDVIGDPGSGTPLDTATFAVNTGAYAGLVGKSSQVKQNKLEIVRIAETGTAEDFRAYSQICTHLGCSVLPTLNEQHNMHCPCHGSVFSSEDGSVVNGPAARALPSLPVSMDDQGRLVVAGAYNGEV
jgi:Rieske Fe-S protein